MTSGILRKEHSAAYRSVVWTQTSDTLAVANVIGKDLVVGQLPARSLATDGNQRYRVLVVGEHIMQFQAERAARQPDDPGEILQNLLCAL